MALELLEFECGGLGGAKLTGAQARKGGLVKLLVARVSWARAVIMVLLLGGWLRGSANTRIV